METREPRDVPARRISRRISDRDELRKLAIKNNWVRGLESKKDHLNESREIMSKEDHLNKLREIMSEKLSAAKYMVDSFNLTLSDFKQRVNDFSNNINEFESKASA